MTIQTIPTATGTKTNFAICDSLHTFREQLEKAGVIAPGDDRVFDCQYQAWAGMKNAQYLNDADLKAWGDES